MLRRIQVKANLLGEPQKLPAYIEEACVTKHWE
jgi:hypothetical protein